MNQIYYLKNNTASGLSPDVFSSAALNFTEVTYGTPLQADSQDLILIDCSILKDKKPLDHLKNSGTLVLVSDEDNEIFLKWLEAYPEFSHIICSSSDSFAQQIQECVQFNTTKSNSEVFNNIKWLPEITLTNSDDRYSIYDKVADYIEENHRVFSEFSDIVTTACSELLSNAFHDAPRDASGEPLYPERDKKVQLPPPHKIQFKFGSSDDEYLWIQVHDTFGTFKKQRLFEALSRAAAERSALVHARGGAGLGLLMMLNWSSAMYFQFLENQSTSVYCKFKITRRRKIFDSRSSHLHII